MRLIFFDVETSGLSPARGDRVIEIGAVAVRGGEVEAEFSTLIEVDCEIHWAAHQVHGISLPMLVGKPRPEEVWPAFLAFAGNTPLIAHNAPFDTRFLRYELDLLGLPLDNSIHCSLVASRSHFPRLASHRLEEVARHVLGAIPADCRLHRALGDARLLARIWSSHPSFSPAWPLHSLRSEQ
ncbi:MAG: 3'-5' exonuclease [Desulfuromonadales bacterium]|nr:3'-5' exonuclease [Desulfuromonadales bacterium]